jgi:uncharacterized protein involved in exopolysaccharide biosynthesis
MRSPAIIIDPVPPPDPDEATGPLWKRLAWFAALALAASGLTAVVAYVLRALPFAG